MNLLESKQGKQAQTADGKGFAKTISGQPLQVIELASNFLVTVHMLYTHQDLGSLESQYESVRTDFPWVNFVKEEKTEAQVKGCLDPFGQAGQMIAIPTKYELR